MALLTVVPMTRLGIDHTTGFVAATVSGDTIDGGQVAEDTVFLEVKNTNAATRDVTLVDPGLTDIGLANPDTTVTVPATTGDVAIPVYPQYINNDTGVVNITYSAVTNLTVRVVRR